MPEAVNGLENDGGHQVKMAIGRTLDDVPAATSSDNILWTRDMTQCCAIATCDLEGDDGEVQRTLYHAQGSNPTNAYFSTLVGMIDPDHTTQVIIGNGSDDDRRQSFEMFAVANVKEKFTAAMNTANKSMDNVVFKIFFTLKADDESKGLLPGSFGIDESGFWGRIVLKDAKKDKAGKKGDKDEEKEDKDGKKNAEAGSSKSKIASTARSFMAAAPGVAAGGEDEEDEDKAGSEQDAEDEAGEEGKDDEGEDEEGKNDEEEAGDEDADEEEQGDDDEPADEDDENEKDEGDDEEADEEGNDEEEPDGDEEQEGGDEVEEGDEGAEAEEGEEGEDEEGKEEEVGDKK
ncbi:hypothetical protein GLAREA_06349 [Glarea lozoyensis ATCC 20868]|uniref:Uncharacterized protein n=1 Tax=Glarea lozoyensis (strain ATCC 20868 / MF5171) TaxID=1116229 RepID=S3D4H7_GLAL2|nr:uncharacterized protein GLAREA_06349 [Glarea lozoyensis ATCC 20868]EPE33337.1 hypothetical protein GLAREA_06349 [Glarea lozoyensis ATCC 20868]